MAEEHSFDIVSKVDFQEVENALSQTRKEIGQRYDFKSTRVEITREKEKITVVTENEFKLHAVIDIIQNRFVKRAVPLKNIQYSKSEAAFGGTIRQVLTITTGIPLEKSKEIVKDVKDKKFKVQSSMQGDQIRVWSKSKDELQKVIQFLREKDYGLELQFANYR